MYKVLIIEDDYNIRSLLRFLIDWDYMDLKLIEGAVTQNNAPEKISEFKPDIIILNLDILPMIEGKLFDLMEHMEKVSKTKANSYFVVAVLGVDDIENTFVSQLELPQMNSEMRSYHK